MAGLAIARTRTHVGEVEFFNADASEPWPERLADALGSRWHILARADDIDDPVIDVDGRTWDDYLAESVSRRTRKETRRRFRRLNEVGEPDYARATIQTAGKDTDTLLRLHDLRWDEVGGSAFFDRRDRATIRSFNYAAAARGWLRLVTLSIDGEPVSSELARRLGDRQTHGGRDQARLPRGAECWREAHDPGFALVRPGNEIAHKSRAWTSSD